jgi:chromosome segregation ATPase
MMNDIDELTGFSHWELNGKRIDYSEKKMKTETEFLREKNIELEAEVNATTASVNAATASVNAATASAREQFRIAGELLEENDQLKAEKLELAEGVVDLMNDLKYLNGMVKRGRGSDIDTSNMNKNVFKYIQELEAERDRWKSLTKKEAAQCIELGQENAKLRETITSHEEFFAHLGESHSKQYELWAALEDKDG